MSIVVPLEDLGRALELFGEGYLLSVSPERTVQAVAVRPAFVGGSISMPAGRTTAANVSANAAVTLLCAPVQDKGHTLIVDGTAEVLDETVRITPTSAVLHRPPYHADGPPAPGLSG